MLGDTRPSEDACKMPRKVKRTSKGSSRKRHFSWMWLLRQHKGMVALVFVALLFVTGTLLYYHLKPESAPAPVRAAIVDQLSLTMPNADFISSVTSLMEQAGYAVDYYPGEKVTVDLYRYLPTFNYGIIILRVHSAMSKEVTPVSGAVTEIKYVSLFTGEPYRKDKFLEESGAGWAAYYEGGPRLFCIGARFVEESMRGRFNNTIIILMGCSGLKSEETARAFLGKGARVFIGWTDSVLASDADPAVEHLLRKLLVEEMTVTDAVAQTTVEFGQDPVYGSKLKMLEANR